MKRKRVKRGAPDSESIVSDSESIVLLFNTNLITNLIKEIFMSIRF